MPRTAATAADRFFWAANTAEHFFIANGVPTCFRNSYRDADAKEIDLLLERDGKLFPVEIKKMATPPKKLTKVFDLIDKSPL